MVILIAQLSCNCCSSLLRSSLYGCVALLVLATNICGILWLEMAIFLCPAAWPGWSPLGRPPGGPRWSLGGPWKSCSGGLPENPVALSSVVVWLALNTLSFNCTLVLGFKSALYILYAEVELDFFYFQKTSQFSGLIFLHPKPKCVLMIEYSAKKGLDTLP